MADLVVRPSLKLVAMGYALVALTVIVASGGTAYYAPEAWPWPPLAAALLFLVPARRHMKRLSTVARLDGDKLRHETGLLGKSTRTVPLSKIQDIRVDQTLGQRILGLGSITVLTAAESTSIVLEGIDNPRHVADVILDAAGKSQETKS